VGAILFFLLGAIAATAEADRHSKDSSISDSRHVAALPPAPNAISDRSIAFASQDGAEYTGGLIPKLTFAAPHGLERIQFHAAVLAPFAHARHCVQYPDECRVRRMAFRGGKLALTEKRWAELTAVNAQVNRSIRPERNLLGVAGEEWLIAPKAGDCNDWGTAGFRKSGAFERTVRAIVKAGLCRPDRNKAGRCDRRAVI
jgi:hypothetical protein